VRVSRTEIKRWGTDLAEDMNIQFKFSEGWMTSFIERQALYCGGSQLMDFSNRTDGAACCNVLFALQVSTH
jgi:hypothetical protein